jgi:hypothetical protein
LVGRDQTAQHADRDLEDLYREVVIEGEVLEHEPLGLVRLAVEPHQQHGVERINRRHVETDVVPVAVASAEGHERVVAPRVLDIAVPGMQELGADPMCSLKIRRRLVCAS